MPDSRIVRNRNAFLLEVGGERLPLYGYLTYQPENTCYEDFKKAGIRLFFCTVYAGDRGINQRSGIRPFRSGFWKGIGQYDMAEVDADFRRIAGNSRPGEIYIIPRLMVDAPSWWDRENPDELCRDAHGTPLHQSFLSRKWLEDTEKMFADLQKWVGESGWDKYIAGWHMAAGNTEEFLRPSHRAGQMTDYSRPAQEAFRLWVKEKYAGDPGAVSAAWGRAVGSFEEVRIPSPYQRLFAADGEMRNKELERETIDYYTFMNESLSRSVIELCAAAKRVTGRRQVIGAFCGYLAGGPECGHHAADMVFASDEIDFLASPFVYTDNRAQGIDWQAQGSTDSAALHGKPWFMEADIRTYLSRPISQSMQKADPFVCRAYDGPVWWGPDSVEGSLGQMLKAFSRALTNNTAIWWFDMWGGWYRDEKLMAFHKKACEIYTAHVTAGGSPCAAETALFMDDELFCRLVPEGGLSALANHILWKELGFTGVPYKLYMIGDLDRIDPAAYRAAVFSGICRWPEERLRALNKWKTDGRVLIFLGPTDQSAASGISAQRLPGTEDQYRLRQEPEQAQNDDTLYFSERAARQKPPAAMAPVLRLKAERGDVCFETDENGVRSLLRRKNGCAVYADISFVPKAERIRALINAAGAQIYNDDGDVIYASASHIAVHAAADGVRRVHIPGKGRLQDEMTGKILPGNESFIDIRMKKGETVLMRILTD